MQAESLEVLEAASVAPTQARAIVRAIDRATRQMYMAMLGQMAMTLGFIYFLFTQLR